MSQKPNSKAEMPDCNYLTPITGYYLYYISTGLAVRFSAIEISNLVIKNVDLNRCIASVYPDETWERNIF